MSSSGLIYAFIVGAWAVYLVPMWLRREDELNAARQTQRYTTAIKVLSHKDSFERKHGAATEREEAEELPAAVGAGAAGPAAGIRTLEKVRDKDRERHRREGEPRGTQESRQGAGGAVASRPRGVREGGVTARLPRESASAGRPAAAASPAGRRPAAGQAASATASAAAPGRAPGAASTAAASSAHALLRLRRRRVVGVLFAITSFGAIVSADLGLSYVWVMLIPAAVLSGYIVWVRKDEQARAAERARRRTAAIRAARESERRRQEEREHAEREAEFAEQAEREELARRSAVARRRIAAARSRADRHTSPDQGDLPRAANG